MRKEFIEFANNQNKMPSFNELTSYANNWLTNIDGTIPRPDGLSLATYKLMRKDAQIQMGLKVIKYPQIPMEKQKLLDLETKLQRNLNQILKKSRSQNLF